MVGTGAGRGRKPGPPLIPALRPLNSCLGANVKVNRSIFSDRRLLKDPPYQPTAFITENDWATAHLKGKT